ncbi:MAG: DsbA family protein [Oscillochloridaceae bacterium umkhey_bin13]
MSQAQSRRGRKVTTQKKNPLVPFYWAVGGLVILGAAFLITFAARGGFGGNAVNPVNAPIGQTAEGFWYKGDPNAPVTVIKYSDYQCPSCAFYDQRMAPSIERDYIETGKVQFVYHEFPLNGHQHAIAAGTAGRCAGDQGQFWGMHDLIFQNQDIWSQARTVNNIFSGYAGQLGLDRAAFDQCLSSGTYTPQMEAAAQSSIARGVTGTPTFDVNGTLVNMNSLPSAIEAALRAAGQ